MSSTILSLSPFPQPVGVPCTLALDQLDTAVLLLRLIERLPELSSPTALTPEQAQRRLHTIHENHQQLAALAHALLIQQTSKIESMTAWI